MSENNDQELKYSFIVMMSALEKALGSKDAAWVAILESHKMQVDKSPDEIREILNGLFGKTIRRTLHEEEL